jgi:hypothetical protein
MGNDLIPRLRALARAEHDDLSVADEAADRIQSLQEESGGWEVASEMWQEQAQQNASEVESLTAELSEVRQLSESNFLRWRELKGI